MPPTKLRQTMPLPTCLGRNQFTALSADTQGSELVEFALTFSVLILIAIGAVQFARALYVQHQLVTAANDAARYAMVRGSSWAAACPTYSSFNCTATTSNITSFTRKSLNPGMTPTSLTVTTTWPGTTPSGIACDNTNGNNSTGCSVVVRVSYPFPLVVPMLARRTILLRASSTVSVSY